MKRVLLIFMILGVALMHISGQNQDVPVVKRTDGEFYRYEVKAKETVYSLCRRFNITDQELLGFNPSLSEGLKKGQILFIPVKGSTVAIPPVATEKSQVTLEKKKHAGEKDLNVNDKAKTTAEKPGTTPLIVIKKTVSQAAPAETSRERRESIGNALIYSVEKPRVTLILPYSTTAAPTANQRYSEFYEGFLLAVDSLKNKGVSFEVQVLESDLTGESVKKILQDGKLDQTDMCIGGVSPEQISILSDWASKNQHTLVVPFSSKVQEIDTNPFIYQTITPYSHVYDRLVEFASKKAGVNTVVFLKTLTGDAGDPRMVLITKMKERFKALGISYKEVSEDDAMTELSKVLSPTRHNLIIPTPCGLQESGSMLAKLSAFHNSNPEIALTLFGYPDWMALGKVQQKYLYELNALIYSNFYADMQQPVIKQFQVNFYKTYNHGLMNMFPKYGMMGYDVAASFIPRMIFESLGVKDETLNLVPLQSVFHFEKSNENGGQLNRTYFLIEYRKDNSLHTTVLQ